MYSIMVVDDSRMNLMVLEEILSDKYDLAVAMDGDEALEAIAEDTPDLILLDIILPGMNGFDVMERIHADPKTADIPVIFLSGCGSDQDVAKGRELGCFDFITKPFSSADVLQRVEKALTTCGTPGP